MSTVWRKVLILVFTLLTILWCLLLCLAVPLTLDEVWGNAYKGMQPATLTRIYATPVRPIIPVFDQPGGKKVDTLKKGQLTFRNFPIPETDWVEIQLPGREHSFVRRADISWDPKNMQGIAPNIQDFNGDGNLEVYRQDSKTDSGGFFLSGPTYYRSSLYGFQNGKIVPYFAFENADEELNPYRLTDGTYAFANRPMIWRCQAYRWYHGKYQQRFTFLPSKYFPLLNEYLFNPVNLYTMLFGLIPAILILLTMRPAVVDAESFVDNIILHKEGFIFIASITLFFDGFCFYNGYHPGMGACVATTVPLLFVCITHLAIIQIRLKELKRDAIN